MTLINKLFWLIICITVEMITKTTKIQRQSQEMKYDEIFNDKIWQVFSISENL